MSEAEPELGVGFVRDQDQQSVALDFPAVGQARRYGKRSAPLKRLEFRAGDTVTTANGKQFVVETVEVRDGLNWYLGGGEELCESQLSAKLKLQRPLARFLAGQWDPLKTFELRRRTLELYHKMQSAPSRGLVGPRAQLLPHQLYVATQVSSRGLPRALLADEVGLGKTIEAGWIMHRLAVQGRVRRVLVLVPRSLINQWFVELLRRFNLTFWVPESQSEEGVAAGDFSIHERVILSLESLRSPNMGEVLARAGWDMVIVDEAHRVGWTPEASTPEYDILERLAARTRGLLLLTATPEQLGLEGHFARLRLIDPARFSSWDAYLAEHERYRDIVKKADKLVRAGDRAAVLELVDRFGTGRIYFRNSRQVVELEHCFFPKRKLVAHRLTADPVKWLGEFARAHREEKTLLICATPAIVADLEKRLREEYGVKAVGFHEKMPLLTRDRNAAYFEDPEGASILLSSEIGGEGRNFQHARHLVMADLPADPDVLEQRIGRLDRIGQTVDIQIHVPYLANTREELLLRWHREVFGAFDAATKGAGSVYERHRAEFEAILSGAKPLSAFDDLIRRASADYARNLQEVEDGRDRLVELNSFDPEEGTRLEKTLEAVEKPAELRDYLETVLDVFGISASDLDADSLFIEPGDSMFAGYFPALPPEGLQLTFSRKKALARDDLAFMSWDHPIIAETMESIVRQEAGNVAVAAWNPAAAARPELRSSLIFECTFTFEAVAASNWHADEFNASGPLRVVLEAGGKELTARFPAGELLKLVAPVPAAKARALTRIPPEAIKKVLSQARAVAERSGERLREESASRMRAAIDAETSRLRELAKRNGLVGSGEIEWWEERRRQLETAYQEARVRLDSFLLVVPPAVLG